jgi:4-hydroxy-tetrahydrodipicolinate synthase
MMRNVPGKFGLSAALATPFTAEGAIDFARLAGHARWCLGNGCNSITAFGTTGEGASLGPHERDGVLGALAGAGIAGERTVCGVMAASVEAAVEQARIAVDFGCHALLIAPPFYFKGVDDSGLFAWFAKLLDSLGAAARGVILYNIPSVTQVPLSVGLIQRLRESYPELVIGVKDSSGDWAYTEKLLAARGDLAILVGDERHLAAAVRLGGAGAISGIANLLPGPLMKLAIEGTGDERIDALVDSVIRYPVIQAIKTLIAHRTGEAGWLRVRPPLVPLAGPETAPLTAWYDATFAAAA